MAVSFDQIERGTGIGPNGNGNLPRRVDFIARVGEWPYLLLGGFVLICACD